MDPEEAKERQTEPPDEEAYTMADPASSGYVCSGFVLFEFSFLLATAEREHCIGSGGACKHSFLSLQSRIGSFPYILSPISMSLK